MPELLMPVSKFRFLGFLGGSYLIPKRCIVAFNKSHQVKTLGPIQLDYSVFFVFFTPTIIRREPFGANAYKFTVQKATDTLEE